VLFTLGVEEKIYVTLTADAPITSGVDVGGAVGFEWSSEGHSGIFGTGGDPKAKYMPLYKLQRPPVRFLDQTFGRNFKHLLPSWNNVMRSCRKCYGEMRF
jgi:hypothetical protein